MKNITIGVLEKVYSLYNKREFVHPDPLEFLFAYENIWDREIAALTASSLAYGRVSQILKSVSAVLEPMRGRPADFLFSHTQREIKKIYSGFKHRFTTDTELSDFLYGVKSVIAEYGSLENCMFYEFESSHETLTEALTAFVNAINGMTQSEKSSLLPDPSRKSACKRLHLFLRWMIRKDDVDPGGWNGDYASKLIVPLDTHMFHFGTFYGFTSRKNPDLEAVKEITAGFRKLCPKDPVKFDFALTRFGIRHELNWDMLDKLLYEHPV